jgi:hypothetical protein
VSIYSICRLRASLNEHSLFLSNSKTSRNSAYTTSVTASVRAVLVPISNLTLPCSCTHQFCSCAYKFVVKSKRYRQKPFCPTYAPFVIYICNLFFLQKTKRVSTSFKRYFYVIGCFQCKVVNETEYIQSLTMFISNNILAYLT